MLEFIFGGIVFVVGKTTLLRSDCGTRLHTSGFQVPIKGMLIVIQIGVSRSFMKRFLRGLMELSSFCFTVEV